MIATPWVILAAFVSAGPDLVEPSDLARRPDLVGHEVVVDDRIRYPLESKRGQGYDVLMLKRTDVPLLLPSRLKYPSAPTEPNVRARGILKFVDDRLIVDVSAIELLPNDVDRPRT